MSRATDRPDASAGQDTSRRLAVLALLAMLIGGAALALWRAVPDSSHATVDAVAAQLRCPACQGESVAQSTSPVAAAMRATIAQQLAAGRNAAQVKAWFAQRYGAAILDEPPITGMGVLLWIIPTVALGAAGALALRNLRNPRHPQTLRTLRNRAPAANSDPVRHQAGRSERLPSRTWHLVALALVCVVATVTVGARTRTGAASTGAPGTDVGRAQLDLAGSLERQGQYDAAADLYRQLLDRYPDDQLRLRLAFTLVRAGRPDQAVPEVDKVLAERPDDPDALLILGLSQFALHSPDAPRTLGRFLQLDPGNPAAAQVRRLMSGS